MVVPADVVSAAGGVVIPSGAAASDGVAGSGPPVAPRRTGHDAALADRSLIALFVGLKWRMLRNGLRRRTRSPWATVGFVVSFVAGVLCAVVGLTVSIRVRALWDDAGQFRVIVGGCFALIFGWWFGPVLAGGVDETVDPLRLAAPPHPRQLRTGQIAAGFVGIAPAVVMCCMGGLLVGASRSLTVVPVVAVAVAVGLLLALVGSRAIATTLARLARSRRGGDAATLVAVLGGSVVFAGAQLIRFLTIDQIDAAIGVLRWTPPGLAGEAILLAGRGEVAAALWRIVVTAAMVGLSGAWWSRQIGRLIAEPMDVVGSRPATVAGGSMPLFAGAVRSRVPPTPSGAAVARELLYLRRSPGRRTALAAGTILGVVYVVIVLTAAKVVTPLAAPVATMFALQYGSNQLGVDPAAFWIEVSIGPPPAARWVARQMLASIALAVPFVCSALVLAVVSGEWVDLLGATIAMLGAVPALVGLGSVVSPMLATPIPDSGNPFGSRQSMQGTGCLAAIAGMGYLVAGGVLVAPAELGLRWTSQRGEWLAYLGIAAVHLMVGVLVWRTTTRFARTRIDDVELEVMHRLDQRLNG
ncbi:MAG: hypothetical protein R2698_06615 [Microthrixaceae bacterium]